MLRELGRPGERSTGGSKRVGVREPGLGKAQVSLVDKPQHPSRSTLRCPLLCLARDKRTRLCHTPVFPLCAQDQSNPLLLVLFSTPTGRRRVPLFALFSPWTLCPGSLLNSSASFGLQVTAQVPLPVPRVPLPCGPSTEMEIRSHGADVAANTPEVRICS